MDTTILAPPIEPPNYRPDNEKFLGTPNDIDIVWSFAEDSGDKAESVEVNMDEE